MALSIIYKDDEWDFDEYPSRLYKEASASIDGQAVKTYEDVTPYTQRGSYVTGGLLSEMVQAMKGFVASTVVMSDDGNTVTERSDNGTMVTTRSADGRTITSTYTDHLGNSIKKVTTMAANGKSVTNTVTLTSK